VLNAGFDKIPCVSKALVILFLLAGTGAFAQQEQPQVRMNYLNVCTPSAEDQATLKSALAKVSGKPAFAPDFEISRGRATLKDAPVSRFVRLRREFASESALLTAQYSMSADEKTIIETLVLRLRDPKDFHEIAIEDRVSAGAAAPLVVLSTDTPAARIRVERLGKSSVALARCDGADQSAYEPLFKQASELMASYRGSLGLRTTFRSDISWLTGPKAPGQGARKQR
jgi:hypothetical protein